MSVCKAGVSDGQELCARSDVWRNDAGQCHKVDVNPMRRSSVASLRTAVPQGNRCFYRHNKSVVTVIMNPSQAEHVDETLRANSLCPEDADLYSTPLMPSQRRLSQHGLVWGSFNMTL